MEHHSFSHTLWVLSLASSHHFPHIFTACERGQPKGRVEWRLEWWRILLSLKGAKRGRAHGLVWARTAFQLDPLTQQVLNANLKESFESGH